MCYSDGLVCFVCCCGGLMCITVVEWNITVVDWCVFVTVVDWCVFCYCGGLVCV